MKKEALEIAGYTVLPLQLPETRTYPKPATHYLYLRPHEPRIPDADTPRSLFVVNIPTDTTETHLRHLFGAQLASGRVERVEFEALPTKKKGLTLATTTQGNVTKSKKRKRVTADDLQTQLDAIALPPTWDRELQKSGARVVVVFVDKPSMEASLKAARKAAKKSPLVWGADLDEGGRLPALGLPRYLAHDEARYPSRAALLGAVNDYMTVFTQVAEARKREEMRRAQEPDEDGFITVTSGPKLTSAAHEEEARALVEKQKQKSQGLEDFYRFQSREKRKERQNELLKRFDEDKKRLEELKRRKGKIRTLLMINRRHAKKFSSAFDDQSQQETERGYESFKEVVKDIEGVVDVLWVSGTPSLQIPYLISLAVLVNSYLPEYPFSPKATFRLLRKLDSVFTALLTGEDAETGMPLPGFENRRNVVSMTEKVRIKSIAESCRVAVVDAREQVDEPGGDEDESSDENDDDEDEVFADEYAGAPGRWEMEAARVYEKTIQLLGDELGKAGDFCDDNMAIGETC
ncbi:ribosomal small subunit assembly protein [Aspergillus floccosus]